MEKVDEVYRVYRVYIKGGWTLDKSIHPPFI